MNVIKVNNLCKSFNGISVLKDVNLNVKKREIVGIIGRNGSGKTVLLKIISGLYFPSSGNVIINSNYNLYKDFGILIDTNFLDNYNAFDNLKNISLLRNVISDFEIRKVLEFVLLEPYSKVLYKNFSTGMKQKLKIAQAIMEKPKFLILDEPFNGLDMESVLYFRKELIKLKGNGVGIIITSHYKEDIESLCDVVYEMNNGVMKLYEKK